MKKFYIISLLLAGVATNHVFCSEEQRERDLNGMADINARDYPSPPNLVAQILAQNSNLNIIRYLIDHRANVNIENRHDAAVLRHNPGLNVPAVDDQQGATQAVQVDESPEPQVDITDFNCPICFEPVESLDMVHRVCRNTAQHVVCIGCYHHMVANPEGRTSNNRCPMCRGPRY